MHSLNMFLKDIENKDPGETAVFDVRWGWYVPLQEVFAVTKYTDGKMTKTK